MSDTTGISGGVTIESTSTSIGGDVVGRDKIINITHNITNNIVQQAQAATERQPLRVLAVIAAPVAGERETDPPPASLSGRAEWKALRASTKVAPMLLARLRPPTALALRSICAPNNAGAFNIVHFICHGLSGALALEDERGLMTIVNAVDLSAALREGAVQLAVINACYSAAGEEASIAQALVDAGVRSVVAHRWPLIDPAAVLFSQVFYRELAAGRSLRASFDEAVTETTTQYQAEKGNAVLRGDEALRFPRPDGEVLPSQVIEGAALPDIATRFFGRGRELIQLADVFAHADLRGAALTGIGGIGKSALAFEAADRLAWRFDDRVAYVRAVEFGFEAQDALGELARGLGLKDATNPVADLRDFVNRNPCLLLFDNMERAGGELYRLADFVSSLNLDAGSQVLFTLRPPLSDRFTDVREINLHTGLDERAALDYVRTTAYNLNAAPQWQSMDEARALIERVNGHPELMRLAIYRSLKTPFARVKQEVAGLSGRLDEALQDLIGKQVEDAGAPGQLALARLAIFPRPRMIVAAAQAACGEASAGLDVLVEHGILALERDDVERYALHPTAIDWAVKHLTLRDTELRAAQQRVIDCYAQWVAENRNNHNRLMDEHDNVLAALDWARQAVQWRALVDLTLALLRFWDNRGYWSQTETYLVAALQASEILGEHETQAQLTMVRGLAAYARDDFDLARELLRQSLALALEYNVQSVALKSRYNLGLVASETKDYAEAVSSLQLTLADIERLDQPDWELGIFCHYTLGKCLIMLGDSDGAERELQTALDLHARYGFEEYKFFFDLLSGLKEFRLDHLDEARACFQSALQGAEAAGDQESIAEILTYLGRLDLRLNRPDEARRHLRAAYQIAERIQSKIIQAKLKAEFGELIGAASA